MNFAAVKDKAKALFEEASFISEIRDDADYEKALALMDELIEDYDENRALIIVLAKSIEAWENTAPEFVEFNQRIAQLGHGSTALLAS